MHLALFLRECIFSIFLPVFIYEFLGLNISNVTVSLSGNYVKKLYKEEGDKIYIFIFFNLEILKNIY